MVSTLRCGRNNPGSNPGHGMNVSYHGNEEYFQYIFEIIKKNVSRTVIKISREYDCKENIYLIFEMFEYSLVLC